MTEELTHHARWGDPRELHLGPITECRRCGLADDDGNHRCEWVDVSTYNDTDRVELCPWCSQERRRPQEKEQQQPCE